MHVIVKRLTRWVVLGVLFALPEEKKVRVDRWLRGREEFRKLRLADCVVVSYGKSGRTWLRVMLSRFYQIKHGLSARQLIGFDNLHKKDAEIPKIFFTHDNYIKDYTGNRDSKADYHHKKLILLVRDPLDTAVSQFFQWKYRMRRSKKVLNQYPQHGSDTSLFDFVMDEDAGLPKIIEFLNEWASESGNIKDLMIVRYEVLCSHPEQMLARIVDFIGTPGSEEEIRAAVDFASVDNMRNMERKKTFWLSGSRMVATDSSNPDSYKVRKAKVGGYRDYFDDDEIAQMQRLVAERLDPVWDPEVNPVFPMDEPTNSVG
jgi:hypothetical protein